MTIITDKDNNKLYRKGQYEGYVGENFGNGRKYGYHINLFSGNIQIRIPDSKDFKTKKLATKAVKFWINEMNEPDEKIRKYYIKNKKYIESDGDLPIIITSIDKDILGNTRLYTNDGAFFSIPLNSRHKIKWIKLDMSKQGYSNRAINKFGQIY